MLVHIICKLFRNWVCGGGGGAVEGPGKYNGKRIFGREGTKFPQF